MNRSTRDIAKRAIWGSVLNLRELLFLLRIRRALKKSAEKRIRSEERGLHIPAFLISSITSSCNLFCKGCYARANNICGTKEKSAMLTADEWSGIFKEARELGISFNLLAGGEPLLRRDVLVAASQYKDIVFPVFTNGTLFDHDYIDLFNKNRNLVPIVSLEGDKKTTDQRRGEGTYKRLTDSLKQMKNRGLLYGASITVTKGNLNEITSERFINTLNSLGCRIVFFIEYVPIDNKSGHIAPDEEDRIILEKMQELLQNAYKRMLFLSFPGDEKHMGGCLAAGRGFFHINSDGAAEACPFSPYSDYNIKVGGLKKALQSSFFKKVRELNKNEINHTGGCSLFEQEERVMSLFMGE
jgi:MoaA/NifB/PqqE/SkfB family radical SAM enzyme